MSLVTVNSLIAKAQGNLLLATPDRLSRLDQSKRDIFDSEMDKIEAIMSRLDRINEGSSSENVMKDVRNLVKSSEKLKEMLLITSK